MWKRKWFLMDEADAGEGGGAGAGVVEPAAAAPAADPAPASAEEGVNWSDFEDDDEGELGDGLTVEGDAEVVPPAGETPPVEAPAPAPAAVPPVDQTTPAPTPAAPAPVEPLQAAPAPAVPTATDAEYSAWRTQRLSQLEQVYAVDPDSAAALLTEPETVLPKLAAKVHMEVLENSMRAMQAMVPVMMQQVQQHTEINTRARNLFTSVNPDLVDPKFEPMIMELGASYRRVNQSAPPDEAARAIGNLVRAALGIASPQVAAPQTVQAAPRPAVAPFTPARGAGGGNAPSLPSNPYELLAMEMMNDEDNF